MFILHLVIYKTCYHVSYILKPISMETTMFGFLLTNQLHSVLNSINKGLLWYVYTQYLGQTKRQKEKKIEINREKTILISMKESLKASLFLIAYSKCWVYRFIDWSRRYLSWKFLRKERNFSTRTRVFLFMEFGVLQYPKINNYEIAKV